MTVSANLPIIAGNWKMNGLKDSKAVIAALAAHDGRDHATVVIFPPYTLLASLADAAHNTGISIGAQDCHTAHDGAHTGDISARQIKDAGADWVILGHSERRHDHHEPCFLVSRKAQAAIEAGLCPIICVGETFNQRKSGLTLKILSEQLRDSLSQSLEGHRFHVSYEPVWAIGTGLVPTDAEIVEAVQHIDSFLKQHFPNQTVQILYGGSVKPDNAAHILSLPHVGGVLVGGASLSAEQFIPIIEAAKAVSL